MAVGGGGGDASPRTWLGSRLRSNRRLTKRTFQAPRQYLRAQFGSSLDSARDDLVPLTVRISSFDYAQDDRLVNRVPGSPLVSARGDDYAICRAEPASWFRLFVFGGRTAAAMIRLWVLPYNLPLLCARGDEAICPFLQHSALLQRMPGKPSVFRGGNGC
jgi:hypothetical protein